MYILEVLRYKMQKKEMERGGSREKGQRKEARQARKKYHDLEDFLTSRALGRIRLRGIVEGLLHFT